MSLREWPLAINHLLLQLLAPRKAENRSHLYPLWTEVKLLMTFASSFLIRVSIGSGDKLRKEEGFS
jgi:hypothetical protein